MNITMSLTAEIRASADATEDDRKQLWARAKERARALGWHDPDDDMYRTGSDNPVEANWELPGGIDAVAPVVAQLHAEFDIAYLSASDYTNVVCGTEGEQVTVCVVEEDGKKLIEIDADFGTYVCIPTMQRRWVTFSKERGRTSTTKRRLKRAATGWAWLCYERQMRCRARVK